MNEKFIYEDTRTCSFNISFDNSCVFNGSGRFNYDNCREHLSNALHDRIWVKPAPSAPIKLEVKVYYPVPQGKTRWFKNAARAGAIPCVTEFSINFIMDVVLPPLYQNKIIANYQQIHAVDYQSRYSIKPRVEITVTKMFQNISDIKKQTTPKRKRRDANENNRVCKPDA